MRAHQAQGTSRLRRAAVTAAGVAIASAFIVYGGAAAASPGPTATQVRQRLDKLMSQLDAVSQQYDQSTSDLKAATATLSRYKQESAQDTRRFEQTRAAMAQIGAAAYEQGDLDSASALLISNDPQVVLDKAALLTHLSSDRRAQLSAYIDAARTLVAATQREARTGAAIRQLTAQKAAEKKRLEALVAKNRAELSKLTAPPPAPVSMSAPKQAPVTYTGPATGAAAKAASFALSQIGAPYVWGGTGPYSSGYDCSGLVMAAWSAAGVQIPRTTYEQWASLPHVSSSSIQPGDLLFYDAEGHVAIYVGGGNIVDAPQPGENVEEIPMSTSWYAQNFDGAARP